MFSKLFAPLADRWRAFRQTMNSAEVAATTWACVRKRDSYQTVDLGADGTVVVRYGTVRLSTLNDSPVNDRETRVLRFSIADVAAIEPLLSGPVVLHVLKWIAQEQSVVFRFTLKDGRRFEGLNDAVLFLETAVERRTQVALMLAAWKNVAVRHGNVSIVIGRADTLPDRIATRLV